MMNDLSFRMLDILTSPAAKPLDGMIIERTEWRYSGYHDGCAELFAIFIGGAECMLYRGYTDEREYRCIPSDGYIGMTERQADDRIHKIVMGTWYPGCRS